MLIEQLKLGRGTDGTWMHEGLSFACEEEFDWLFDIPREQTTCTLLIFDSPEDGCKEIFIEPITDEEEPGSPLIDYNLFWGGTLLTGNGTYRELRRQIRLNATKGGTIWAKVE